MQKNQNDNESAAQNISSNIGDHDTSKGRRALDERRIEESWRKAALRKYGAKTFALIERGWAAGFFDGEGSVSAAQGRGVNCTIEQAITGEKQSAEKDIAGSIKGLLNLERFRSAVGGVGKITRRPHRKRGNEQQTCQWAVTSQTGLEQVCNAIRDFLSLEKRNQFADALGIPAVTAMKHDKPLPKGWVGVVVERGTGSKNRKD